VRTDSELRASRGAQDASSTPARFTTQDTIRLLPVGSMELHTPGAPPLHASRPPAPAILQLHGDGTALFPADGGAHELEWVIVLDAPSPRFSTQNAFSVLWELETPPDVLPQWRAEAPTDPPPAAPSSW